MRLQSAHDELAKMRPGCLDDTMRGWLLMRGARLTKFHRDALLTKTNFEYSWRLFAPLFKRMSADKGPHVTARWLQSRLPPCQTLVSS